MLNFNYTYIQRHKFLSFSIKYEWYITGVEYNWDYNIDPSGFSVIYSLPASSFLTVLACIPLVFLAILAFFSFFPTGNVHQSMLEDNKRGSDISSGVNLLCSNAFTNEQQGRAHCGTFVYDNNDPSGQSIQGLFYLGKPIVATVNGRFYEGYLKRKDNMLTRINGQTYMSVLLVRSMDQSCSNIGAGYVISKSQPVAIQANNRVYSGSTHLVPNLPQMRSFVRINRDKLPVYIRSLTYDCFIYGFIE